MKTNGGRQATPQDDSAPRRTAGRSAPRNRARIIALMFLGWTVLAGIPATSAYISAGGDSIGLWLRFFLPIAAYYYLWGLATPLIYRLVDRQVPWSLQRQVFTHVAVFLVATTLAPFIVHANDWRTWLYGPRAVGFHTMGAFSYTLILLGCLALKYYRLSIANERAASHSQLRAAVLQGQLSQAQVDALRMQINPHFLFNALNSISALIETRRNDEAYRTTEMLGELLRTALDRSTQQEVTLDDELGFVDQYLAIEQIRFGSRLCYQTDVPESLRDASVPALVLQPLVENAIKHGVAPLDRKVTIHVHATARDNTLTLRITDSGPGLGPGARDGLGLRNVRDRLTLRYDNEAQLEMESLETGGTRVTLTLPLTQKTRG